MSNACSMRLAPRAEKGRGAEVAEAMTALRAVARRWSRDQAGADDLLQEAALRAMTACERFPSGGSATAWMRTVLYRLAVDETRRHRRRRDLHEAYAALGPAAVPPPGDEEPAPPDLDRRDLRQIAGELPPALGETFWLWAIEKLPYQQISARLGIPLGTVGTRLLRARQLIRARLPRSHRPAGSAPERCRPSPRAKCGSGTE